LTDLETRLGHSFADKALLVRALTHASKGAQSNERLEFLGDRVLGLIVASKLYALYPDEPEGKLALKFNALVRGEACARVAEAAGLADHLILAASEAGSGGRRKTVILAGVCEAVIAALYFDGGYEAAQNFVERYWSDAFEMLGTDMRDAKTALQEWAQGDGGSAVPPSYRLVSRDGLDHAPRFVVEVSVAGQPPETGKGRSKREAEQAAARRLLTRLGLTKE
jgi:ribonuclease-3